MKHIATALIALLLTACGPTNPSADKVQARQQEVLIKEATMQTGMPAIKNFRERKLLKMILELRDQEGLVTYTYTVATMTGKPVFLCNSVGFAISDATGYTNPERIHDQAHSYGYAIMPQAEPNGLYTPDSTEGSWVMCSDPATGNVLPVLSEARLIVSPFKLH